MKGIGGCLLVFLGLFGLFFSIVIGFTFYLLPLAFLFFIGSLLLISYALGPIKEERTKKTDRGEASPSEKMEEEND